jgi:putative transposase
MHCALRSRIAVPLTKFVSVLAGHDLVGSMSRVGAAGDNAAMESFFALLQKNVLDRRTWAHPAGDPHDPRSSPGRINPAVTQPCGSPWMARAPSGVSDTQTAGHTAES